MADMKNDLTCMVSQEITNLRTKLTGQLNTMTTTLKQDMNNQISNVLKTITTLNQWFNEVMEWLPPNPNQCLPTKNPKGWALPINVNTHLSPNFPNYGTNPVSLLMQLSAQMRAATTTNQITRPPVSPYHCNQCHLIPITQHPNHPYPPALSLTFDHGYYPIKYHSLPKMPPPHTNTNTTDLPTEISIPQIKQPPEPLNLQTLLTSQTNNVHWGDKMNNPKPFNTFRVLARNVNTMSNANDYLSWKAAAHAIKTSKADALAFQETNLAWNKIHCKHIYRIFQSSNCNTIISTSSSAEISPSSHQCSSTLQAIIGDWSSRSVQIGQDASGLSHWSFIKLQGKEDYHYIILSGYCMCENQTVDPGSNNAHSTNNITSCTIKVSKTQTLAPNS